MLSIIEEANKLARQLKKPRPGTINHVQANRYMRLIAQDTRDLIDRGATGLADKVLKRAMANMQNMADRGHF